LITERKKKQRYTLCDYAPITEGKKYHQWFDCYRPKHTGSNTSKDKMVSGRVGKKEKSKAAGINSRITEVKENNSPKVSAISSHIPLSYYESTQIRDDIASLYESDEH
jgi:hypothetical protein